MTKHNVTLPSCSDYVSEHPTVQAHYEALMKYNADVMHYVVWTDKSGLMGLKDQYGNALLLPLYEEIIPLNINAYVVKQKGKYGAIRGGKQVVDCTMDTFYYVENYGMLLVSRSGLYGWQGCRNPDDDRPPMYEKVYLPTTATFLAQDDDSDEMFYAERDGKIEMFVYDTFK